MMNIWCAQTKKPKSAIATDENATAVYPNTRFRLNVLITSEITPMPGRIMMYTAGWE